MRIDIRCMEKNDLSILRVNQCWNSPRNQSRWTLMDRFEETWEDHQWAPGTRRGVYPVWRPQVQRFNQVAEDLKGRCGEFGVWSRFFFRKKPRVFPKKNWGVDWLNPFISEGEYVNSGVRVDQPWTNQETWSLYNQSYDEPQCISHEKEYDISWVVPLPSSSHHQDVFIFTRGSL